MFSGTTSYHVINAEVTTAANKHQRVSIEVRDGTAKVRKGSRVLEERAGVTKVFARDAQHATITFEDGQTWESMKLRQGCGSCGG